MADIYYSNSYRLRSAGPAPYGPGDFILQTFGIDKSRVKSIIASTTIDTVSDDMTGAGGDLTSANWQRLPYVTDGGSKVYNGTEIQRPTFIDQDIITYG